MDLMAEAKAEDENQTQEEAEDYDDDDQTNLCFLLERDARGPTGSADEENAPSAAEQSSRLRELDDEEALEKEQEQAQHTKNSDALMDFFVNNVDEGSGSSACLVGGRDRGPSGRGPQDPANEMGDEVARVYSYDRGM